MTDDEKEYARALERSMTSIENCCADMVGSLEKMRASLHTMVGKTMALDELNTNLGAIAALSKTMTDLVSNVGRLNDRVSELEERRH